MIKTPSKTQKIPKITVAEQKHITAIWDYYKKHKRDLPWRNTRNVYNILISELMLQQTQVSRVLIKYEEFLKAFPNIQSLAKASNTEVLKVWKGLGYNRRAFFLKRIAETLATMPDEDIQNPHVLTYEKLLKLPGIGQSTAGAIMAFSHNIGVPFIETNIRTIYIADFFSKRDKDNPVSEAELHKKITRILSFIPKSKIRDWYYALYDYGSMLKSTQKQTAQTSAQKSKIYKKQSTFKGSNRQLRAHILHCITESMPKGITESKLQSQFLHYLKEQSAHFKNITDPKQVYLQLLQALEKERQVMKKAKVWYIS